MEENKIFSLINLGQGKLLGQIYSDLAKPSVKKVGQSLGTVLDISNTILLPLKLINEKSKLIFQKNISKYEEKLSQLSDDKIITVPNEIGIPILDRLTYISNEEISDAFVNLLAKASSSDTINFAHPGFIPLIDRLAPDEAKLITYLHNKDFIPFITYHIYEKGKEAFHVPEYAENLTGLELNCSLNFPQNIKIYLDNLVSIGVLRHETTYFKTDETIYKKLEETYADSYKKLVEEHTAEKFKAPDLQKGYFDISDFGKLFIKACTDYENNTLSADT
jgi:hypothetical protein